MDWLSLQKTLKVPPGLTARGARLWRLQQVFEGRMYDALEHDFSTEYGGNQEYVPMDMRRPNVQTNLCRSVVDDVVSLLFSDSHWPTVQGVNSNVAEFLGAFIREARVPLVMQMAAARGSIGSAAVLFETFNNVPRLTVLDTPFLTPRWSFTDGELEYVEERVVCTGQQLLDAGIFPAGLPDETTPNTQFMCIRRWERKISLVFRPVPIGTDGKYVLGEKDEVEHKLGFVPIVWMKNIDTHDGSPDGDCTFERAISTVIAADYTMSQGGRALKYNSDPKIVFTQTGEPGFGDPEGNDEVGAVPATASRAIMAPGGYNVKLLEITGEASTATLNYYRELRAMVLEQLHGNKTHPDKLAASQSGRAMEMMAQSLVWLADRLRSSYGDGGLLPLLQMAMRFSAATIMSENRSTRRKGHKDGLKLGGVFYADVKADGLTLHWPAWYPPTAPEMLQLAEALATAVDSGIQSRQTAVSVFANSTGCEPLAEWALVKDWQPVDPAGGTPSGELTANPKTTRKRSRSGPTRARSTEA